MILAHVNTMQLSAERWSKWPEVTALSGWVRVWTQQIGPRNHAPEPRLQVL